MSANTPAPEQAHTQEPWDWSYSGHRMATTYSQPVGIHSGGTQLVGGLFGDVKGGKDQAKANAERIVACVNACAGLNPSALPDAVKALEEINKTTTSSMSLMHIQRVARAALASLKGAK